MALGLFGCELDGVTVDNSGFSATFDDALGLGSGDRVYVAGVKVGRVKKVALDAGKARVVFAIDSTTPVAVYSDACVAVSWYGHARKAHVQLKPGTEGTGVLAADGKIECIESAGGADQAKVNAFLDQGGAVLAAALTGDGVIARLLSDKAFADRVEAFFATPVAEQPVPPEEDEDAASAPKKAPKAPPKAAPKAKPLTPVETRDP